jgi:hypothetical protein
MRFLGLGRILRTLGDDGIRLVAANEVDRVAQILGLPRPGDLSTPDGEFSAWLLALHEDPDAPLPDLPPETEPPEPDNAEAA